MQPRCYSDAVQMLHSDATQMLHRSCTDATQMLPRSGQMLLRCNTDAAQMLPDVAQMLPRCCHEEDTWEPLKNVQDTDAYQKFRSAQEKVAELSEYEKEIQKRKAKNAEELKKVTRAIKEHESMKRSPPSPAKGSPPTAHASCESIKAPRHELPSPLLMLSQPKFQTGQLIYAIYGSSKRRGFQKFKGTIVASHAHMWWLVHV